MGSRLVTSAVAALVALVSPVWMATGTSAASGLAPRIEASPDTVVVGATTSLRGTGFAPDALITLLECAGRSFVVPFRTCNSDKSVSVRTDGAGSFVTPFAVALCPSARPVVAESCFIGQPTLSGIDTDVLTGAARITVTDPWHPFGSASALVRQQYQDLLGRAPDPGGVAYWTAQLTNGGLTAAQVIASFLASGEFGTSLAPVIRIHLGLTGRPPTNLAVLLAQLGQRRTGTPTAALADAMIAADPHLSAQPAATFVDDAYRFAWGAGATPGQLQSALAALGGGASRGTVLVGITDHDWARAVLAPKVDVIMTYVGMLRRVPDDGGYAYWIGAVGAGRSLDDLIAGFQYSLEYTARFS